MYRVAGRSCCDLKSQCSHQNRNVRVPHGKVKSAPRRNVFKTGFHLARDIGITGTDVARARAKNFAFFYASRERCVAAGRAAPSAPRGTWRGEGPRHQLNTTGRAILDIFELERMHAPVQALSKFYPLTIVMPADCARRQRQRSVLCRAERRRAMLC